MTLKDRISEDIKTAMKAQDKVKLEAVRGIKKVILEKESEVRAKGRESLTEEEEITLLSQQAKQRRDSIEQYQKANRTDLAAQEAQELTIIESYLPAQLSAEEVEATIRDIIQEVGAASPKDMGKVMGPVMQRLKGKADGKTVQTLVQKLLQS
jgi:uncharacterized protein